MERDAFAFHLRDAAVDVHLLHLEIGNAITQKAAGLGPAFIDMHLVAGARQLLRSGKASRPRTDHRYLLAGLVRRDVGLEALRNGAVGDLAFDRLDGDRVVVDIERAGRFARRRADAAGEFRKIVGRVQVARGFVPVAAIDQIVPVRDLVVDRTAGRRIGEELRAMAIGHAAIHATRRLVAHFLFRQRQNELMPMLDTLLDRRVFAVVAVDFEKPGDLAHLTPPPASWRPFPLPSQRARGRIRPASLS